MSALEAVDTTAVLCGIPACIARFRPSPVIGVVDPYFFDLKVPGDGRRPARIRR